MAKKHYEQLKETVYSETLPNGLRVLLMPKPEMTQTFGIFTTDYGSIDQSFVPINEKDLITVPDGIAHFLEHKLFEKEDHDVFQFFTQRGASANAYTSFTKTAYLFTATSDIAENATTLLDFVQDPYFSNASVEKEKGIIAQEIQMYDDQPDWRAFFGVIDALYHHHPVQIDIAGTVESIQAISKEDLYTCYHTFYHPSNMIFTLTGNFDPDEMMELIRKNQAEKNFEKVETIKRDLPVEPTTVNKKNASIEMPVSISKCMIGIKEEQVKITDTFMAEELMADMLLDYFYSKSGEYYQELYDGDLIDAKFGFESHRQKNFAFSIIGGNTNKPDAFAEKIKQQLASWKTYQLTDEAFLRMKKKKIGEVLREMNSMSDVANQLTHYEMIGFDFFDLLPTLEKLTKDQVNQFLNHWIIEENIAVFQVNPSEQK